MSKPNNVSDHNRVEIIKDTTLSISRINYSKFSYVSQGFAPRRLAQQSIRQ